MNDAHRTDAITDLDPRAWEALLVPRQPPETVAGGVGGSTAPTTTTATASTMASTTAATSTMTSKMTTAMASKTASTISSTVVASNGAAVNSEVVADPEMILVPDVEELDRVRSKLAALRDGLRAPALLSPPLTYFGGGGGGGGGGGDGGGGDCGGGGGGGGGVGGDGGDGGGCGGGGGGGCGGGVGGDGGVGGVEGGSRGRLGSSGVKACRRDKPNRWEGWEGRRPPWWIYSPFGCPLDKVRGSLVGNILLQLHLSFAAIFFAFRLHLVLGCIVC